MTPEQVLEGAIKIRRPDESMAQAAVRAAIYLRIHELMPPWTLPDDDLGLIDWSNVKGWGQS